jgi:transcriptional regulator with XRE-family HTH domain
VPDDPKQPSAFAARLRMALARSGLQGKEFAERAGVSEATVSRWLTGKMDPPPGRRRNLEAVLRLPKGWLDELGFIEPPGQAEIDELHRDPDYQPEGSGLESQLEDDDVLDLLLFNRTGFTRYLMTRFDSPRALPVQAKLGFLDHLERIARERGLSVPKDHLDHLRGLIRGGGL